MRNNQPVTQREYPFPVGKELVSVTDLKGQILYCNDAFEEVSGFGKAELLGQPHNVVRHPDMPPEAYRDMWETLQSGHSWTAIVKNRRKNGDHYWVSANVNPLMRGDQIAGYISIRVEASRDQIQQAEVLYGTMQQEAAMGILRTRLERGQVIYPGVISSLKRHLRLPPQWRLILMLVMSMLLVMVANQFGLPTWGGNLLFLGIAGMVTFWSYNNLVRPLQVACYKAEQLSFGNLGIFGMPEINHSSDESTRILNALELGGLNVRTVVASTSEKVQSLRGAIAEVAAGNLDLSQRTESQASSLQQAAASMEEINSTVKQSADSVARASELAQEASEIAHSGDVAVHSVVETMQAITDSSTQIGQIIQVIESVAFQTNILALNAAVEAARAGEQGRGFAVVAAEVRSLAQRTTSAAQEIRALIETSRERVNEGNQRTQSARAQMQKIMQAIESVNRLLTEVCTAADEQRIGVAQITEVVNQLDGITQQNAALVEEIAASSKVLELEVNNVNQATTIFSLSNDAPSIFDINAHSLKTKQIGKAFELKDAIPAHTKVKINLRNAAVNGQHVDADTLRRDDACALGHWLHGEGEQRYGRNASFGSLKQTHRDFHRVAGKVADLINTGRLDAASQQLTNNSEFARATQSVVAEVMALHREIE